MTVLRAGAARMLREAAERAVAEGPAGDRFPAQVVLNLLDGMEILEAEIVRLRVPLTTKCTNCGQMFLVEDGRG